MEHREIQLYLLRDFVLPIVLQNCLYRHLVGLIEFASFNRLFKFTSYILLSRYLKYTNGLGLFLVNGHQ